VPEVRARSIDELALSFPRQPHVTGGVLLSRTSSVGADLCRPSRGRPRSTNHYPATRSAGSVRLGASAVLTDPVGTRRDLRRDASPP
jgi:hypothetical protein